MTLKNLDIQLYIYGTGEPYPKTKDLYEVEISMQI